MAEKYKYCPRCSQPLEDDGSCPGCSYGHKRQQQVSAKTVNPECPWNDHGLRCNRLGSMSDATNGAGPWYCGRHYWKMRGIDVKETEGENENYRARWYRERGLLYQPPKLEHFPPFKCVAVDAGALLMRLQSGELGPKRLRQPGDDDEEIAA